MSDQDRDWERYKIEIEKWKKETDTYSAHTVALINATISYGGMALKGVTIINGFAAVSLLAFMGHVVAAATQANATATGIKFGAALALLPSMGYFVAGTTSGVIATCVSYLAQSIFLLKDSEGKPSHERIAEMFRIIAILIVIFGIGAFGRGGMLAIEAFSQVLGG